MGTFYTLICETCKEYIDIGKIFHNHFTYPLGLDLFFAKHTMCSLKVLHDNNPGCEEYLWHVYGIGEENKDTKWKEFNPDSEGE